MRQVYRAKYLLENAHQHTKSLYGTCMIYLQNVQINSRPITHACITLQNLSSFRLLLLLLALLSTCLLLLLLLLLVQSAAQLRLPVVVADLGGRRQVQRALVVVP